MNMSKLRYNILVNLMTNDFVVIITDKIEKEKFMRKSKTEIG